MEAEHRTHKVGYMNLFTSCCCYWWCTYV